MRKTNTRVRDRQATARSFPVAENRPESSPSERDKPRVTPIIPIRAGHRAKRGDSKQDAVKHGAVKQGAAPWSDHVLGPVLAETAHDLNNALSTIRLQLDLLALDLAASGRDSSDGVLKRLRMIQPAIRHATDITKQFLDPEGPTRLVSATALNLVLQRMVPILSAMLPPGVALQMRLVPNLGPVALEPVQVVRIVSNLVLNSCAALGRKANSTANGTVTIETANDSTGGVVLRVRDTGAGMSAATRANLFRPFFTTKKCGDHSGLGLSSVLRMVRHAGGTIRVESAPGAGAAVEIRFPAAHSRNFSGQRSGRRMKAETASRYRRLPSQSAPDHNPGPSVVRIRNQG